MKIIQNRDEQRISSRFNKIQQKACAVFFFFDNGFCFQLLSILHLTVQSHKLIHTIGDYIGILMDNIINLAFGLFALWQALSFFLSFLQRKRFAGIFTEPKTKKKK